MKIKNHLIGACVLAPLALLASVAAQAEVIVHGTRVLFPGKEREVTVRIQNTGKRPALVQAWADDGTNEKSTPEMANAPFVLRPPMFRLYQGKSQVLRILSTAANLPKDRESLYWLNVLDIPPAPSSAKTEVDATPINYMQLSVRTRLKLIYRPEGLNAVDAAEAQEHLQWSVVSHGSGWALQANNPTPYYVNLSSVGLSANGQNYPYGDIGLVAPASVAVFPLKGLNHKPAAGDVQFQYVNDQGAVRAQSVPLAQAAR